MPTKIRLMRIGSKKRPFYRVVAVDERKKRTGTYIELLGTYNPLTEPKEIILKQDRIDYWLNTGAIPSTGYLRIMKQAPQKPPRKPKKEKKEPTVVSQQPTVKEEKAGDQTEETPTEEAPLSEETNKIDNAVEEVAETRVPDGQESQDPTANDQAPAENEDAQPEEENK